MYAQHILQRAALTIHAREILAVYGYFFTILKSKCRVLYFDLPKRIFSSMLLILKRFESPI
jgi:hypothetical protein